MKFFLVLALCLAVVLANHHYEIKSVEEIRKTRKQCMDELKLSEEDREHLNKYEYPDRESIHKYVYCTSTKLQFFDDTHGYHLEHLVEQLGQNKDKTVLREKIRKCLDKNEVGSTVQVWAYRNWKCLIDTHIFDDIKPNVKVN